jgi:hypothetical protein
VQIKDKQPVCPRFRVFESSTFRSRGEPVGRREEREKKCRRPGSNVMGNSGRTAVLGEMIAETNREPTFHGSREGRIELNGLPVRGARRWLGR